MDHPAVVVKAGERVWPAITVAVGAALGALLFGYALGFSSPSLAAMEGDVFHDVRCSSTDDAAVVTSAVGSLWSAIVNVGCMAGAIAGGRLIDVLGRRGSLLYGCAPCFAVGWAATAVSRDAYELIAARLVIGAGVGLASVSVPVYIAETSPASLRGALGAVNQLAVTIGIFLVYLLGMLLPHSERHYDCGATSVAMKPSGWRLLAWVGALMGLFLGLVAWLLPETPAWLTRHGHKKAAARSLALLNGNDSTLNQPILGDIEEEEEEMMISSPVADQVAPTVSEMATMLLPSFMLRRPRRRSEELLRGPFRLTLALMLFQQFSGINAVIFFAGDILGGAGMENRDLGGLIVMAIQVAATAVACLLMDRAGRRPLLIGSMAGMALALVLLVVAFVMGKDAPASLSLLALVAYVAAFSLGLGPIPWLYMPEILPAHARGVAASAATLLNWTASFAITEAFASTLAALGAATTFAGFAVVCASGAVYVAAYLPETKGLYLDQISRLFLKMDEHREDDNEEEEAEVEQTSSINLPANNNN